MKHGKYTERTVKVRSIFLPWVHRRLMSSFPPSQDKKSSPLGKHVPLHWAQWESVATVCTDPDQGKEGIQSSFWFRLHRNNPLLTILEDQTHRLNEKHALKLSRLSTYSQKLLVSSQRGRIKSKPNVKSWIQVHTSLFQQLVATRCLVTAGKKTTENFKIIQMLISFQKSKSSVNVNNKRQQV